MEEEEYTIVGSAEADPFSGKISNDSPIAQALIGKQLGDQVIIATPGGDMTVKNYKSWSKLNNWVGQAASKACPFAIYDI